MLHLLPGASNTPCQTVCRWYPSPQPKTELIFISCPSTLFHPISLGSPVIPGSLLGWGETGWDGKSSQDLFVILCLFFASVGKWEEVLGGAGRGTVPIHSRGVMGRAGSHWRGDPPLSRTLPLYKLWGKWLSPWARAGRRQN